MFSNITKTVDGIHVLKDALKVSYLDGIEEKTRNYP